MKSPKDFKAVVETVEFCNSIVNNQSIWLQLRKRWCRGEFEDFPGRWIELLEPSP